MQRNQGLGPGHRKKVPLLEWAPKSIPDSTFPVKAMAYKHPRTDYNSHRGYVHARPGSDHAHLVPLSLTAYKIQTAATEHVAKEILMVHHLTLPSLWASSKQMIFEP